MKGILLPQATVFAISIFLVGCGPSGSSEDSDTGGNAGGGGSNPQTADYCEENYPAMTSNTGNVYVFDAEPPACFGLVESPALRKEVPFSISTIDIRDGSIVDPELTVDATVKLLLRQSGFNFGGYELYASLTMANNSSEYYCYRPDDIELKNASGGVVVERVGSTSRSGGALFHSIADTTFRCLPPGQTHQYIASASLVSESAFNSVASATMSELRLDKESASYRQAPVLNAEMTWLNPGKRGLGYPTLEVTWTNTTGETVELEDDTHNVWLMDEDGYAVSRTYVRLDEGLNIDDTELQPDDYVVVNGGTVTLSDDAADNAVVTPSSATRALIYLDWVWVE